MSASDAVSFSLVSLEDLRPVLNNEPLGATDVKLRIASARLTAPVTIPGVPPLAVRFKAGAELSVFVLNGRTGPDADGVVAADSSDAWAEYVCAANVEVDARAPAGPLTFAGRVSAGVTVVDYRHHSANTGLATAVRSDLASQRVAFVREHVLSLAENDALAFETHGELTASVAVEWSDIFTSEIAGLARLLDTRGPIAIETKVGATCSAKVTLTDTFRVAFGATGGAGALRVAIRKGQVRRTDIRGGLSVTTELDDRGALQPIVDDLLNALGLTGEGATADMRDRATAAIEEVARTKIGAAFSYEYNRVASDATMFEAAIAPGQLSPRLHAALVCGDLASVISSPPDVLAVSRYLNEQKTTITRAWGFTLGIGKWQAIGRDRRRLTRVIRYDIAKEVEQRSYIGSGGYERTHLTWMVDFKADMRGWSAVPMAGDYSLGLHIAWIRDMQTFTAGDLETALDFAALWKILPETSLPWLRERLSPLVGSQAEWSFHVRLKDDALRSAARGIAAMTAVDFAAVAGAAMDAGAVRQPPSIRRTLFTPLWRVVLNAPERFNVDIVARSADRVLPDPRAAWREREVAAADGIDADTVAGIVRSNPDTFDDCERLIRGCRVLTDALATSTRDDGVIENVYSDLVTFWRQSHQVRMLGALVTDLASDPSQIDRALNIGSGGRVIVISSRQ